MGFTRNYDNLVTAYQCIGVSSGTKSEQTGKENALTITSWGGSASELISGRNYGIGTGILNFIGYANDASGSADNSTYTNAYSTSNLICGPGTLDNNGNILPESYEDNKMNFFSSTDITYVKHWKDTAEYNLENKSWSNTYHKVYTANKTITIKEIGIRGWNGSGCLLYRKILDAPVTIEVKDGITVNFEITFTQTVKTGLSEAYYDTKIETYEEGEVDWS